MSDKTVNWDPPPLCDDSNETDALQCLRSDIVEDVASPFATLSMDSTSIAAIYTQIERIDNW